MTNKEQIEALNQELRDMELRYDSLFTSRPHELARNEAIRDMIRQLEVKEMKVNLLDRILDIIAYCILAISFLFAAAIIIIR